MLGSCQEETLWHLEGLPSTLIINPLEQATHEIADDNLGEGTAKNYARREALRMCYILASNNGASLQSARRRQSQGEEAGTSQSTGEEFFSEQRLHELLLVQELEF